MRGMKFSDLFGLLRDAVTAFGQDRAPRLAAAIAYYAIFAIAPLLVLLVAVASYVLAGSDVQDTLLNYVQTNLNLGPGPVNYLRETLVNTNWQRSSLLATLIGLGTLFLTATGLFAQLQDALNSLWGADPPPTSGAWNIVRTRLIAFALVLFFGALIVAFLVGNTLLSALATRLGDTIGFGAFFARLATFFLSTGLFTLVFATVYKYLPDVKLQWRETWVGAMVTASLFTLGQILIGFYFARFSPGSAFGAASTPIILLLWVYFSAQIFFFGAEVTWVYSQRFGSRAGGAHSPAKKAMMARLGARIDPTPSPKEQEAARRTPAVASPTASPYLAESASTVSGKSVPEVRRVRRGAPALPSIGRLFAQVGYTLLALPALPVVWLIRRFSGKRGEDPKFPRPPRTRRDQ